MKKHVYFLFILVGVILLTACQADPQDSKSDSKVESTMQSENDESENTEESEESEESTISQESSSDEESSFEESYTDGESEPEESSSEESSSEEGEPAKVEYPWSYAIVFFAKDKEHYAELYNFDASLLQDQGIYSRFRNGDIYLIEASDVTHITCTHTRIFYFVDGYLCSNNYYGDDFVQYFLLDIKPWLLSYHNNELWYTQNKTLYRLDLTKGGEAIVTIPSMNGLMNVWGDIAYFMGSGSIDYVYHFDTGEVEEVIPEMYEYYSMLDIPIVNDPI